GCCGGEADHTIGLEKGAYEGEAFDVGIAVRAAEAKAFAQVGAHDIAIQHFHAASTGSQALLYSLSKGAFTSAGEASEPDGYAFIGHVGWIACSIWSHVGRATTRTGACSGAS